MKITDFKIYVINLDRRPDRLETFLEKMKPLDLPEIVRFPAVDGKAVELPKDWKNGSPGGWGCFKSHWNLIKQAYDDNIPYVMIFEDDAEPLCKTSDLQNAINELPENWEQFYLGCQHFYQNTNPPVRISDGLVIPYNANRTHAYALSRKGMEIALGLFEDYPNWQKGWHIDWAYGSLHETKKIKVYAAYPPLFGQAAGKSDINGADNHKYAWKPVKIRDTRTRSVAAVADSVGYGQFESEIPDHFDKKIYDGFFAHAPSEIKVIVSEPTEVFAAHGVKETAWKPSFAVIDGKNIGSLTDKGEVTPTAVLEPGSHTLEFVTSDNRAAHTYWIFRPLSVLSYRDGAVFEIFSNGKCPRHCSCCNQQETMKTIPDYEYTVKNAEKLVTVLTRNISLIFSGGEPALLGIAKWKPILEVFRNSGKIDRIEVTTSNDNEKWIAFASKHFDKVHLSHRPSMNWTLDNRPDYLLNVEVWDTDTHCVWPEKRWTGVPQCCCQNVGVHAAIFGDTVAPCVLARELEIRKPGSLPIAVPLEDYFTGRKAFPPIGSYEACRWCVNNDRYRETAKRVPTA